MDSYLKIEFTVLGKFIILKDQFCDSQVCISECGERCIDNKDAASDYRSNSIGKIKNQIFP
ncbi:hypothetical protein LEP1GSC051_2598 [Leptospira sp. P2653]|nr:hypothetical protein LEP1GSC051_2598 [Leptospira sp. P2653]